MSEADIAYEIPASKSAPALSGGRDQFIAAYAMIGYMGSTVAIGIAVVMIAIVAIAVLASTPSDEIPWPMTKKVMDAEANDAYVAMRDRYPCSEYETDLRHDQIVGVHVATDLDTNNQLVLTTNVYPDASVDKTASCVSADGQILHQVSGPAVADFIRTSDCVVNQPEYLTFIDEYTFRVCNGEIGHINKDWTPPDHPQ